MINVLASLALFGLASSSPIRSRDVAVNAASLDKATNGPAAALFQADSSIPVAAIAAAAKAASVVPALATYPVNTDKNSPLSTIHSDWVGFSSGAAYSFIADMDVDCDGLNYQCEGNPDGQSETNFGALAAYEVPFVVIPDKFAVANKDKLPGNNIVAVICNGKMFYGIFGDTNGDSPQVTGEASWLMARTCFPADNLTGANGHVPADVTYIFFTGPDAVLGSSAMNKNYITDFDGLRAKGNSLVSALAANLKLTSSPATTPSVPSSTPTATASTPSAPVSVPTSAPSAPVSTPSSAPSAPASAPSVPASTPTATATKPTKEPKPTKTHEPKPTKEPKPSKTHEPKPTKEPEHPAPPACPAQY